MQLSTISLALTRLGGLFSPNDLFQGGTVQGAWYDPSDLTTLFSDRTGTTPCGTPGGGSVVPVGAMLDKRAAGYSVFFAGAGERYSVPASSAFAYGTGAFTVEAWIYATAIDDRFAYSQTVNAQNYFGINVGPTGTVRFIFGVGGGTTISTSASTITTNTWYHIAVVREGAGTNETKIYVNGVQQAVGTCSFDFTNTTYNPTVGGYTHATANAFSGYISNLRVVKGTAVYSGAFTPSGPLTAISGTSLLTAGIAWSGNPAFTNAGARVDGLNPFTASPVGNHAIAANDTTARPELSARVNLLTYSEQFDNGAWSKTATSVVANTIVTPDPLGGNAADKLEETAVNSPHYINIASISSVANTVYSLSIYAKAAERTFIQFLFVSGEISGNPRANFDLSTGQLGSVDAGLSATITPVGNGWYRCSVTFTAAATTLTPIFGIVTSSTAARASSYLGVAGNGIYIWGADFRPANIGTAMPAYQRISDANTYDAVGFPRYLAFNGTSSAMSTPGNVNLSGTDKATVFAGVRKLSDVSRQMLTELSATSDLNAGSFGVYAPETNYANKNNYGLQIFGNSSGYGSLVSFVAPISNVVTASFDIGATGISFEIVGRVNSAPVSLTGSGGSAGTGNFGTYPLFIGARNNASLFFNGNIYSLLVVGSAVSAGNITSTEQWVAGKVGITI